jgi:hypothetical protein
MDAHASDSLSFVTFHRAPHDRGDLGGRELKFAANDLRCNIFAQRGNGRIERLRNARSKQADVARGIRLSRRLSIFCGIYRFRLLRRFLMRAQQIGQSAKTFRRLQ